ncbi:MAG TPA: energy transducer TonB [Candidatus Eisenbacteria bacterium]|nr:energy transducer TonB [Candidatus Eisenbacteria bacterium]
MEWREKPSVLRRGAAPPDERTSAIVVAIACVIHLVVLPFFFYKTKPPTEIALPASMGARTRTQLVRLSPLRTLPPAEAAPASAKAKPKPALLKKYQPGAKITIRDERAPTKKGKAEDSKPTNKVADAPAAADPTPRWFSSDSSRVTSAKTDGDFRFAYYLATLRNKIGSRWVPPPSVDARGRPIKTTVYFRVHRDGQISQASIESSSGYAFFDQTAMRALLSATPLPPLPAGFTDNYLGVHFGFEFEQ